MIGRRQMLISALTAFVLEVLLLLGLALWLANVPESSAATRQDESPPEPDMTEESVLPPDEVVVLVPAQPVVPVPPKRELLSFQLVETTAGQNQGKPERPTDLVSDRATRAAGESARSDPALPARPTVAGVDLPGLDLVDQNFHDGPDEPGATGGAPGPAGPDGPPMQVARAAQPEQPAAPKPAPEAAKPAPVAREPATALLELPGDLPRVAVPRPEEMLRPRPETAQPAKPMESADLPARPPGGGGGGGEARFQSRKIRRAMEGTLNQRGRASLDVEDTPLGRYLSVVSRVVERDWQRACSVHRDMITPGFLRLNFTVAPDGKVSGVRPVEIRDGGEASKWFTVKSVQQASFPPIPKEVVELLENGRLEINFNFVFFQ